MGDAALRCKEATGGRNEYGNPATGVAKQPKAVGKWRGQDMGVWSEERGWEPVRTRVQDEDSNANAQDEVRRRRTWKAEPGTVSGEERMHLLQKVLRDEELGEAACGECGEEGKMRERGRIWKTQGER